MPEKRYKKNRLAFTKSVFLFINYFFDVMKTFYTQVVFSVSVAKVSTLAFSGISEVFLRAAKEHRKKFNNIPSSLAALRVKSYASSLLTCMAPSRRSVYKLVGINPAPIRRGWDQRRRH
jgi:hypothetical protein